MSDTKRPPEPLDTEYEPDILTLEDEEGQQHSFEVLDAADIGDDHYLAMVPYHEDPAVRLAEDAEMVIMKVGEEDGEEVLDPVDDDEELGRVGRVFIERLADVYDIDLDALEEE